MTDIPAVCEFCGQPPKPIRASNILHEMTVFATKNTWYADGGKFRIGGTLDNGKFLCATCQEVLVLFEDYFDAWWFRIAETDSGTQLLRYYGKDDNRMLMPLIPDKQNRGHYLPNVICERVLVGAGINPADAKGQARDAMRGGLGVGEDE